MENKSPAAVSTKPSRFGTRSLEIASRRCVNWQVSVADLTGRSREIVKNGVFIKKNKAELQEA